MPTGKVVNDYCTTDWHQKLSKVDDAAALMTTGCFLAKVDLQSAYRSVEISNKKRYDSELPYQRPDLIEVMEIEIDLTTSTNIHTNFYKSVRECLDC